MRNFREIVHEFSPMLYWHVRRIVVSHEDAQDVLQETFIKAYRNLFRLRDESKLKTWLYRIATNESIRLLSARKDNCELNAELEAGEYVDLSCEAEIRLHKALLRLTPLQRSVFCLRYYDEMPYSQIARVCSSSEGSVKVLYHKAKETVIDLIEE